MKPQSKKMSIIESIANTVTGLLMSFYIQLLVFPMFGIVVTTATNLKITADATRWLGQAQTLTSI